MHKRAVAALVLLLAVVAATVVILIEGRGAQPAPEPSPQTPVQRTLLVQVRDPALLALGSVLLGVRDDRHLDELLLPADWWIDQLGPQEVSVAELGRKPVPYAIETMQAQVQTPVDNAWVMDRLAFAGLVDAVDGVRVDVPDRAAYLTEQGTPRILDRGVTQMTGAQAADYVLDSSLRNERVRAARFAAVWDQILRRFPADTERARALVVSLGALSKATMDTDELADYLSRARGLLVAGDRTQALVPLDRADAVRVRPAQGVRTAFALDARRMGNRMRRVFNGYPALANPVARVAATTIRDPGVEQSRRAMGLRGWTTAWAGRTDVRESRLIIDQDVDAEQAVGLAQALDVRARREQLAWGQADVRLAMNPTVPPTDMEEMTDGAGS